LEKISKFQGLALMGRFHGYKMVKENLIALQQNYQ